MEVVGLSFRDAASVRMVFPAKLASTGRGKIMKKGLVMSPSITGSVIFLIYFQTFYAFPPISIYYNKADKDKIVKTELNRMNVYLDVLHACAMNMGHYIPGE